MKNEEYKAKSPSRCDRLFTLAEDKRFAQFAVPESAFASRCSLGFFDRCTVFPSLYRPPDALGQNAHAA